MGGLPRSRSSEPVSRPTALKIPPHVPLAHRRGLAGGSAVGRLAHALPSPQGSKPCGGCDSLPGATAAASEPSNDPKLGGTAAGVTRSGPKGSDWRAGRAGLNTSTPSALQRFSGPASGLAGARADDLAGVSRSAQRRACDAGQFDKRGSFKRSVKEAKPARSPGAGTGPWRQPYRRRQPLLGESAVGLFGIAMKAQLDRSIGGGNLWAHQRACRRELFE